MSGTDGENRPATHPAGCDILRRAGESVESNRRKYDHSLSNKVKVQFYLQMKLENVEITINHLYIFI